MKEIENKYYKECNVVMLPTKDITNINLYKGKLSKDKIGDFDDIPFGTMILPGPFTEKSTPQHLYIISDDEIKEGDWFISPYASNPHQLTGTYEIRDECKKIIATTGFLITKPLDEFSSEIGRVPQLPQAFIKKYCELGGVDSILVEYVKDE